MTSLFLTRPYQDDDRLCCVGDKNIKNCVRYNMGETRLTKYTYMYVFFCIFCQKSKCQNVERTRFCFLGRIQRFPRGAARGHRKFCWRYWLHGRTAFAATAVAHWFRSRFGFDRFPATAVDELWPSNYAKFCRPAEFRRKTEIRWPIRLQLRRSNGICRDEWRRVFIVGDFVLMGRIENNNGCDPREKRRAGIRRGSVVSFTRLPATPP